MTGQKIVAARWLLLCALAFGLVGMHHLGWMSHSCCAPAGDTMMVSTVIPGGDTTHPSPSLNQSDEAQQAGLAGHGTPHGVDGLLHMCLAVLVAGLVLVGLWTRQHRATRNRDDARIPRYAPRPPPEPSALLTSLGVLRL